MAFRLGGSPPQLPPAYPNDTTPVPPQLPALATANADRGQELFGQYCAACHSGRGNEVRSAYPDLHRLTVDVHARFTEIVHGGALKDFGMASFADVLSVDQVRDIHAHVVRAQRALRAEEQAVRR